MGKMKQKIKKIISLLLLATMVISGIPQSALTAYAQGLENGEGVGQEESIAPVVQEDVLDTGALLDTEESIDSEGASNEESAINSEENASM